ncbi:MAG: DUF4231 domain-containing protein [Dehalococcoidia bacterium]|nr:DUF4231 domain-containing protein [Dehalococcoidia bacterium]
MGESMDIRVKKNDLPALFRAADSGSVTAQRHYSQLIAIDLTLLVIAAILGSLALASTQAKGALALASAIILGVSIIVTGLIRIIRFEQVWYDGRAIAESVKSLAWRYMTCTEPYSHGLKAASLDQKFTSDLSSILAERSDFSSRLGGPLTRESQITKCMREVRKLNTEGREKVYLSDRINDQRRWYGEKTDTNQKSASRLFLAMIVSQILALIAAIILVRWPAVPINPTGILVTLAAVFFAWLQFRRHQELARSYGLAAQELGLICEQARHVKTADELSNFVSDSENAISREHTLWLARRNQR